ncbi:hypothetical protein [uncultured Enterobacter sp.]|nr:hypothetical protein [uncultured Enterobacter sp.]
MEERVHGDWAKHLNMLQETQGLILDVLGLEPLTEAQFNNLL